MINLASKIYMVGVKFAGSDKVYTYISCFGNFKKDMTVIVDSPQTGLTRVKVYHCVPYMGHNHRDIYRDYKPIISMEHQFSVEVMEFKQQIKAQEASERLWRSQAEARRLAAHAETERLRKEEERRKTSKKADLLEETATLMRMIHELEQRIAVL